MKWITFERWIIAALLLTVFFLIVAIPQRLDANLNSQKNFTECVKMWSAQRQWIARAEDELTIRGVDIGPGRVGTMTTHDPFYNLHGEEF